MCPTPKDPSIPYCSYYDRFQMGLAGYNGDLNVDLNDYGSLFEDIRRSGCCPETVQRLLYQKIDAELRAGGFGKWLGGGDIYLIVTTALQLGARGALPLELHNKVRQAIDAYVDGNSPLLVKNCSWPGNTCMDDYAVGAAGFAWAAAYVYRTGADAATATQYADRAREYFRKSFSQTESVCLHRASPDTGGLVSSCQSCEPEVTADGVATLREQIRSGQIQVAVFNHDFDNPNYGVGLFTSLAVAAAGLEAAGQPYSTSDAVEATIAQGLFRHGQQFVDSPVPVALYEPTDGGLATDIGWGYTMGYAFTPTKTLTVTSLGGFFNGTKAVYLYNRSTGAMIASTTVTAANSWGYAPISPVALTAGTHYSVGVYLAGTGGAYRYGMTSMPAVLGDATIEGTCYRPSYGGEPCAYSGLITGTNYGMADIRYTTGGADGCQDWNSNCSRYGLDCGVHEACEDGFKYRPGMYPVKAFLQRFYGTDLILGATTSSYPFQFDVFCPGFVDPDPAIRGKFHACGGLRGEIDFFGDGRLAAYRDLPAWVGNLPWLVGPQWTAADVEPPRLWADVPAHMQVVNEPTDFVGWAIDRESAIVSVKFQVDGADVHLDGYNYGGARTDVCEYFGLSKCPYCPSGWGGRFDPKGLANGTHLLHVTATDVSGKSASFDRYFVVNRPQSGACSASPPVGSYNVSAYYAGMYDYNCGYYKYTYGYDPYGYCSTAAAYASQAGVSTTATGSCSGGAFYNYYAGLYDYYCRYYEYISYGWDYGSYCYWSNYYATVGGCTGCSP
jgi:hypothetical protein